VTFVDPDADDSPRVDVAPASLRLEQLVLSPGGGADERVFLETETQRIREIVDGDGWRGCKERALELMRADWFWTSPDRFEVLARIEYVDRVEAALRTAEKLANRLSRTSANGSGPPRDLVELLAERLFILDRACAAGDATAPTDAFLEIRAEPEPAARLREMYEAWGRRRGMRLDEIPSGESALLVVAGIGAYPILAPENGLHVFESPAGESSFDRETARVTVAPCPPAPADADARELARRAFAELPASNVVVRRYRSKPSPLVRDSVRDWRTGRLDRVLAGEFDVIVDGA
jgi:ATP-dependent Clp protease ATP-binding subunit ClpC